MSSDEPDWSRPVWGPASMTSRLERRTLIENHGVPVAWLNKAFDNRIGKFFPRGCRGWIDDIEVYCYDSGAAGGTITVYIAPFIGCGVVQQATLVIPPGGAAAWRAAAFNLVWNYDALFIHAVCSTTDLRIGYDTGTPPDSYDSANQGLTWTHTDRRMWARAIMKAETAGDVPVSGTLDVIRLPASAGAGESGSVPLPDNVETSLLIIHGAGVVTRIAVITTDSAIEIRFYVDGVLVDRNSLNPGFFLSAAGLNAAGYTATTPQIQLTVFAAGATCHFALQVPFEFRNRFEVRAWHNVGAPRNGRVGVQYNIIR